MMSTVPLSIRPGEAPARRRARPVHRWWRDAAGLVAWATVVFVTALWVSDGGVQQLGSAASGLTSAGRLTGLVSAALLLLQVLLMARIPWVERSYGQDALARRHRLAGFTSFVLLCLHIVLISLGYAAADRTGLVAEVWDLVTTYPGMLLATAGTVALVLVVATSVRAARRRLRYESWHLLHLYAYLRGRRGAGLPGGAAADAQPAAPARGGSCGAGRERGRLRPPARPPARDVARAGRAVLRVAVPARPRLDARQAVLPVRRPGRPPPSDHRSRPGPRRGAGGAPERGGAGGVWFEGPYGTLTGAVRTSRKITLFASGIGITPLRALLEELPYARGDAVLFYRFAAATEPLFHHELEHLARTRGVRIHYLPGPRARDRVSWLPAGFAPVPDHSVLRRFVPDIAEHDVYVCGPTAWARAAVECASRCRVPRQRIHFEQFAW
jgi:predicted ferric reductase